MFFSLVETSAIWHFPILPSDIILNDHFSIQYFFNKMSINLRSTDTKSKTNVKTRRLDLQIISYYWFYVLFNQLSMNHFLKIRTAAIEIYFTPGAGGLFNLLLFNNRLVFYLYLDKYSKMKGQSTLQPGMHYFILALYFDESHWIENCLFSDKIIPTFGQKEKHRKKNKLFMDIQTMTTL